ncbi:Dehydrogenase/reductase SDR family member 7 [Halotydeus destructor]|nr:Dehydrogenase/reductase SDR family member 7 [Halotydeus destructor]
MDASLMLQLAELMGQPRASLQGKVIWIVGASSGIGAELAVQLAEVGSKLILSARRVDQLEQVKARCLQKNGRLSGDDVVILPLDLGDHGALKGQFDQAVGKFGQLDVLVNNGAMIQVGFGHESTLATERKLFDINVFGVIELTRMAANYWIERDLAGHLVVTSSIAGFLPAPVFSAYSATKHALNGYLDSMRPELRCKNITIGIFCPGPVATELAASGVTGTGTAVAMSSAVKQRIKTDTVIMMSAERCGQLLAIFIANKTPFAIACNQPVLLCVKFAQYFPAMVRIFLNLATSESKLRKFTDMNVQ